VDAGSLVAERAARVGLDEHESLRVPTRVDLLPDRHALDQPQVVEPGGPRRAVDAEVDPAFGVVGSKIADWWRCSFRTGRYNLGYTIACRKGERIVADENLPTVDCRRS
jgi:hypothetical protein